MKTTRINTLARITGLTIALTLFAGVAGEVKAQEKGSAKGGAIKLLELSRSSKPAPLPSEQAGMSCPKCKSEFVRVAEVTTKGTRPNTSLLERHLCPGCSTTIKTVGHGKAKRDVAKHECTSGGAVSLACCATK